MDNSILRNEFATVEVKTDESANGVRLMIRDLTTGNCIYLDPLELEALTRVSHEHFRSFIDAPGASEG